MDAITPIMDMADRAIATSTGRVVGRTVSIVSLVALSINTETSPLGLGS